MLALALACLPLAAFAQSTGSVRGIIYVRDGHSAARGAAVPQARVALIGRAYSTVVSADVHGFFGFWNVPPGPYVLIAGRDEQGPHALFGERAVCVRAGNYDFFELAVIHQKMSVDWAHLTEWRRRELHEFHSAETADLYSIGEC